MLYVIGDSHTRIWSGIIFDSNDTANIFKNDSVFSNIRVHHFGQCLAYNLMKDDGVGKWGEEVINIVNKNSNISAIALSIGEIDIRNHVYKWKNIDNITLQESAERVAKKIISFCKVFRENHNLPVFINGIIGSSTELNDPIIDTPNLGTMEDRNLASLYFDNYLKTECYTIQNVYYVSVIDKLINSKLETKIEYLAPDKRHLNLSGFEIIKTKFIEICQENNLPNYFE